MNQSFVYLSEEDKRDMADDIFTSTKIRQIPVLKEGLLVDIIFKHDRKKFQQKKLPKIHLPVVIMAGGLGTRLDPFTRILPKPLLPVGEKPIIEVIIERFLKCGIDEFYISLNHKARMVKAFFEEASREYKISFIEEEDPLGTAGSLRMLEGKVKSPFIVSNCDILIESDYSQIYDFHKEGQYALTIVASMQHHIVPYGVCQTEGDGELKDINEKPYFDFLVNTGMYFINPETIQYIPKDQRYDITELIHTLKEKSERVGVFPISDKSWVDVGQWEEYQTTIKKLSSFI
jgi:NDP-sugar pyrophosphorylase family protein